MRKILLTMVAIATLTGTAYSQYGGGSINFDDTPLKLEVGVIVKSPTSYAVKDYSGQLQMVNFPQIELTDFQLNSATTYYLSLGIHGKRSEWLNKEMILRLGFEQLDYTYNGTITESVYPYKSSEYLYNNSLSRIFFNISYYYYLNLFDVVDLGPGIGIMAMFPVSSNEPYSGESAFANNFGLGLNAELKATLYIKNFFIVGAAGLELNILDYFPGSSDIIDLSSEPKMFKNPIPYITVGIGYYFSKE